MDENKESTSMSEQKDVVLYCDNGHKKTVSESCWANWKASHGPGTVIMCRKCNDKVMMLSVSEISHSFRDSILTKAAEIEAQEAAEGKYFRELYKPKGSRTDK